VKEYSIQKKRSEVRSREGGTTGQVQKGLCWRKRGFKRTEKEKKEGGHQLRSQSRTPMTCRDNPRGKVKLTPGEALSENSAKGTVPERDR